MRLGILLGALSLAPLIVGCGHNNDAAVRPSDAGAKYVPADHVSGDASNPGLVGGLYGLTPDQLAVIRSSACFGEISDGGDSAHVGEDGGTCTMSFPTGQVIYGRIPDPRQIGVVWTVESGQSILIGESTSDCPEGDGWYLDSNTNIILCPQTCSKVNADAGASIQVYAVCFPSCLMCNGNA